MSGPEILRLPIFPLKKGENLSEHYEGWQKARLQLMAIKKAVPDKFLKEWLKTHPVDVESDPKLAELAAARGVSLPALIWRICTLCPDL